MWPLADELTWKVHFLGRAIVLHFLYTLHKAHYVAVAALHKQFVSAIDA